MNQPTKMSCSIIREATENLLYCGDDYAAMKRSVDQLYVLFSEITGINSDDLNEEHLFLSSGKAISPSSAAFCLLEFKRTAVFLRGIDKAILQKIAEINDRKIHILYAGTGPYATLLLPLLTLYSPEKIQIDLLDINEKSLKSAVKLLGCLQLDPFIGNIFNSDASTFSIDNKYDIVVSETMQAALKKEPQVAIMQNLIPQMTKDSIFIPQSISVKASLAAKGQWNRNENAHFEKNGFFEKELGAIGKNHLDLSSRYVEMDLPPVIGENVALLLATTITVFDNEILSNSDCSLTFPVKVCKIEPYLKGKIGFWYKTGSLPGFRCRINDEEKVYEAFGRAISNW